MSRSGHTPHSVLKSTPYFATRSYYTGGPPSPCGAAQPCMFSYIGASGIESPSDFAMAGFPSMASEWAPPTLSSPWYPPIRPPNQISVMNLPFTGLSGVIPASTGPTLVAPNEVSPQICQDCNVNGPIACHYCNNFFLHASDEPYDQQPTAPINDIPYFLRAPASYDGHLV